MAHRTYQGVHPAASQLPPSQKPTSRRWASPLLDFVILASCIVGFYIVTILPTFRLTTVEVEGTEKLNPAYVVEQSRLLLSQRAWLVVPQSSYFFVSTGMIQEKLILQLRALLPVSEVRVVKRFPRSLLITIREQAPVGIFKTRNENFILDAAGVLTTTLTPDDKVSVVEEVNGLQFKAGDHSLSPTVLTALPIIREALESRSLGPVVFQTPPLECPFDLQSPTPQIERSISNNNVANNSNSQLTNTSINTNQQGTVAPIVLAPLQTDCDLKILLQNSTEIVVVTGNGWTLRLDTAKPVGESLKVLFQALDSTLKNQSFHSVDIRFAPRVIYK